MTRDDWAWWVVTMLLGVILVWSVVLSTTDIQNDDTLTERLDQSHAAWVKAD